MPHGPPFPSGFGLFLFLFSLLILDKAFETFLMGGYILLWLRLILCGEGRANKDAPVFPTGSNDHAFQVSSNPGFFTLEPSCLFMERELSVGKGQCQHSILWEQGLVSDGGSLACWGNSPGSRLGTFQERGRHSARREALSCQASVRSNSREKQQKKITVLF